MVILWEMLLVRGREGGGEGATPVFKMCICTLLDVVFTQSPDLNQKQTETVAEVKEAIKSSTEFVLF